MGINQLHALMSMHVHKNILDIIHLADVANGFVGKKRQSQTNVWTFFSKLFTIYGDWVKMYNDVHNILRLCDSVASFPFTTIRKKRDY